MMTPLTTTRLLFAGGGTGGHLFPAIAIADRIGQMLAGKSRVEITFVGTERGIEYRLRESLGYELELINVRGLARSLTLKNLLVPFLLIGALLKARAIIKAHAPDVVIGTGGYVSYPVLRMASFLKITTVLQEQNSYPGIATRHLAGSAKAVYLGFEAAKRYLPANTTTVLTGNPVRASITAGDREEACRYLKLDPVRKTILVLGGSQGSRAVNNAVLKSLQSGALKKEYQLLWLSGKRDYKDVESEAGKESDDHSLFPFESRMELVYAVADIAIARAGALTLAELEACSVPAIVIPFPHAAGDHQRHNAREYVDKGMAQMIDQNDLGNIDILTRAATLIENGQAAQMAEAIAGHAAGRKLAVDLIAEDIIRLAGTTEEATIAS